MKIAWAVILAALIAAIFPAQALAHASIVRSEPPDNAVLAVAPSEVWIWFNEPISPRFSSAQLLDVNGQSLPISAIRVDPSEGGLMVLSLPALPDGLYSVRWKVLSEADGHFTQGLLVFGVGEGVDVGAAARTEVRPSLPWPEVLLRWLNFGVLAALVGALAVAYMVLAPGAAPPEVRELVGLARQRDLRWAAGCSGLALLVGLGLLSWQIATLTSTLPEGVSALSVAEQLVGQTRWGALWLARQAILLFLTLYLPGSLELPGRWGKWLTGALGVILMAVQALTGHAAALAPHTALAVAADALHLLAAGAWVGGLLALVVGLFPLLKQNRAHFGALLRAGWGPFGRLAALSVGVLAATGLYSLGRQVASLDALLTTLYGRALLGKIGLMLAAGALGLLNALLLHPRVAAPLARLLRRPAGWTPVSPHRLPALVLAEASLGLVVFLGAGLATASPPARGPAFAPASQAVSSTASQSVDDLLVTFSAQPNRPGQNVFTVRTASTRRPPPAEVMRVMVRFTFLGQDMGRASAEAGLIEPGLYQLGGNYLSLAGPWQVEVAVRRRGLEDSVAHFDWTVAAPGPARPALLSDRPWEPWLIRAAAAVVGAVLALTIGAWLSPRRDQVRETDLHLEKPLGEPSR